MVVLCPIIAMRDCIVNGDSTALVVMNNRQLTWDHRLNFDTFQYISVVVWLGVGPWEN
jgi:hypothetical protein